MFGQLLNHQQIREGECRAVRDLHRRGRHAGSGGAGSRTTGTGARLCDHFGDHQRQLVDVDGLPLKSVLEQIDLLGEKVVPVLREEFAKSRPATVPDAPTHASLLATRNP
jgi:hypothetical protein